MINSKLPLTCCSFHDKRNPVSSPIINLNVMRLVALKDEILAYPTSCSIISRPMRHFVN